MKKALLGIAILAASGTAVANESFNGRLSGMSGAGLVTGGHIDGVLLNPSLGADYGPKDDFGLALNLGAFATDQDELLDSIDDLSDFLDYLDAANITNLTLEDADRLQELLSDVDGKTVYVGAGASLLFSIPNRFVAVSPYARSRLSVSVTPDVDEGDYTTIIGSVDGEFESDDLESTVRARGVLVNEVGIALAKTLRPTETSRLLVGATPKRVQVTTILYDAQVNDFDEDDLDADDYTVESSMTNLDVGVTYITGNLRYGLVVRDLISKDFDTIDPNETFSIKTQSTAAVGYQTGWFKAEVAVDLNAAPNFALRGDTQLVRAGFEFDGWRWVQLRGGFQTDLKDSLADTFSVGLGFSPFNVLNLDLSAVAGSDNTYGGNLQLGLRF